MCFSGINNAGEKQRFSDIFYDNAPYKGLRLMSTIQQKLGSQFQVALIIDTGWNHEKCKGALTSGLEELNVNLKETDFFITHLHADHSGLVSNLTTDTSRVYFSRADGTMINSSSVFRHWEEQTNLARIHGFPEDELERTIKGHPGRKYSSRGRLDFYISKEGDIISIGDYSLRCIETPGHTKGHMCLYEPDKKMLISGDHILIDITPNITLWDEGENPLKEYLESLEKVYALDVELVLPGHRSIFKDHKERVRELQHHHQARLEEILSILERGEQNTCQVASQMTWDVAYESWNLFPSTQKWFAFGEALAHLKFLEDRGEIIRKIEGQKILFSLQS